MDKKQKQELLGYLHGHPICVVATVSKEAKPHAATVYYLVTEDLEFYFMTNATSRKSLNISENNNIAMVVGTDLDPRTIQLSGTAARVETEEGISEFLKELEASPHLERLYRGNFVSKNPFQPDVNSEYALFKIDPDWMRWTYFDTEEKKLKIEEIDLEG